MHISPAPAKSFSISIPGLSNRLAVEIVPPVILVAIWFYTGSVTYLIVLIAILVIYNVQRVFRQYRNIAKLKSISKKIIGEVNDENKA